MINFNFGHKKPDKKQLLIIGTVLTFLIAALSQCTGVSQNAIWDLLDEIQRKYLPQGILNELILQDPDKVGRRVERDVSRAIDQVTPEYDRIIAESNKKYKPRYLESSIDQSVCYTPECQSLGGEMRICSVWACPPVTLQKESQSLDTAQ